MAGGRESSAGGSGAGGGRQTEAAAEARRARMESIPPYMRAVSGSLGGIVEACCLQPIDVIKTRLQLDQSGNYRGIAHCGATVARTEGVLALWKGLTPFAAHLTLKYALRMGSNALFQSAFKDSSTGHLSNRGRILSGFGAGVLEALVIVTPFEASPFFIFLSFLWLFLLSK
ncbi:putative mitochondrial succinate-fumarate transporter 1-like [Cocos nucifera]|uniref:Putative mitochondrial succinate-fumarate transporter 1-like n=1 Tax=Cocos nucifera TaxID=13894 RepID=A0A8K0NDR0_COCNU|nr:putative mitochondrial succinate-fumarate transporter 1-like [Cocos nucifera]